MKVLVLGDLHGEWSHTNVTIADALRKHPDITHIIQLGDFGYGWPGIKPLKFSRGYFTDEQLKKLQDIPCMFLDGNHENHDRLDADQGEWQPGWTHMPRGSVLEIEDEGYTFRVMFFGGATSVDKALRIPHVSWWPQEEIEYGQVQRAIQADKPIHAIFSHDHPAVIPYSYRSYSKMVGHPDRSGLDALRKHFRPPFWFFGHHHHGDEGFTEDMSWACCPLVEKRAWTIWTGYSIIRNW